MVFCSKVGSADIREDGFTDGRAKGGGAGARKERKQRFQKPEKH